MKLAVMSERPNFTHGSGSLACKLIPESDSGNWRFVTFASNGQEQFFDERFVYRGPFERGIPVQWDPLKLPAWKKTILHSRVFGCLYKKHLASEYRRMEASCLIGFVTDAYSATLTAFLADSLPGVPVHVVIWDLLEEGNLDYILKQLFTLGDRVKQISVISEPIRELLAERLGFAASVVTPFVVHKVDIPMEAERSGLVMTGHARNPDTRFFLEALAAWWKLHRPGDPMVWYGNESMYQGVPASSSLWTAVEKGGMKRGPDYLNALAGRRWGLIPFDTTLEPSSAYTRFSIPSRIADYVGAGTPILFLGSEHSASGRLIKQKGIGVNLIEPERSLVEVLKDTMDDRDVWARLHANCLAFAEELTVEKVREKMNDVLCLA